MIDEPLLALALFLGGMAAAGVPLGLLLRQVRRHAEARADLFASISHDIRTPINGVIGFADLLRRQGALTPAQTASVEHIAQSGQTMVRLLNDILDFTRAEAGRLTLDMGEVRLHDELAYCTAMFAPRAAEKGIALTCSIDPAVPVLIAGDALRLRQVLLNIIGNAVKFTDCGHVHVQARAEPGALATQLSIEVADTGIGIAPAAMRHIFERYRQADAGIARSHGGAGLGLAICAQLVRLMDGWIDAVSREGTGSSFIVHLPVRVLADTAASSPVNKQPELRAA
ncbi:sensor histidine kinase [Altererythrobacter lauratis]|uniref:histidine kinase n=1 Tax=Alteraurantiacibacter lauratis TaxID=2054627 RepID=A0ABV7EJ96_9SPHN